MTTAEDFHFNVIKSVFEVNIPDNYDKYTNQEFTLPFLSEVCHTFVPCTDSNSLLHCLALAFDSIYLLGGTDEVSIDKKQAIKNYRLYLAKELETKYNTLNNGNLLELVPNDPNLSLSNMIGLLKSDDKINENFVELISNIIECDIYIIDFGTKQAKKYNTGYNYIIHNRRSVILVEIDNLYHLLYTKRDDVGMMCYPANDPLILEIRNNIESK